MSCRGHEQEGDEGEEIEQGARKRKLMRKRMLESGN